MSRLRRPFLYDRCIFVTVKLLPSRAKLEAPDYERLASSLAHMRQKHGFALTAWVFLRDHWHAIIYPPYPLTISTVFKAAKVSSKIGINLRRRERGELWQDRFYDHALRTVREYNAKVDYIHLNPVRRQLVRHATEWKWSSVHEYAGVSGEEQERRASSADLLLKVCGFSSDARVFVGRQAHAVDAQAASTRKRAATQRRCWSSSTSSRSQASPASATRRFTRGSLALIVCLGTPAKPPNTKGWYVADSG